MDYFKLFNLERIFDIDKEYLENSYLELQKKFHPDQIIANSRLNHMNGLKNETSKENILDSILINDAYKIIKNDYLRSCYLLGISDNENSVVDHEFLEEILSINEHIHNEDSIENLFNIKNSTEKQRDNIFCELSNFHKNNDFSSARNHTIKLRYYDQIITNIDKKIEKCF